MKIRIRDDKGCDLGEVLWEADLSSGDLVVEIETDDGVIELWDEHGVLTCTPKERSDLRHLRTELMVTCGDPTKIMLRKV